QKKRAAAFRLPLNFRGWTRRLLQAAEREIGRQFGDEGLSTPVRARAARIDRRDVTRTRSARIAGEGVAIALVQIGAGVAQIDGEHLVGEPDTDVPRIVVFVRNAVGKGRARKSVERVACT